MVIALIRTYGKEFASRSHDLFAKGPFETQQEAHYAAKAHLREANLCGDIIYIPVMGEELGHGYDCENGKDRCGWMHLPDLSPRNS